MGNGVGGGGKGFLDFARNDKTVISTKRSAWRDLRAGVDGHEHIVPGVTVGDGENVEIVDFLTSGGKGCRPATDKFQVKLSSKIHFRNAD